ncbi:unnamed protein product [Zymoseptoria tritici ST99CH_1A5]|uniref:Nuclear pore complex protein n=1 Tax=Zymoseptoria tritici ST99CH_1A5 TaxID=1276529 RepID=A0A1Y6L883_ZYMTR|nr:unnamed protein product [Zymoseptoria tritici ST99CH_1A5]
MAPVTRKSAAVGNGVNKKAPVRKPRATRSTQPEPTESWDFLEVDRQESHESDYINGDVTMDNVIATREDGSPNMDDAINPLREMAERVGREVETFAERLDQFLDGLPSRNKYEAAVELVEEFRDISAEAAHVLEEKHEREMAMQLRKEWSERAKLSTGSTTNNPFTLSTNNKLDGLANRRSESVKQWRHWQQEADLWELFRLVLDLHHNPDPNARQQEKERKLAELGPPHRYTSESHIYRRFLLSNDLANERSLVKRWLEQAVDHQETDLSGIMEELETKVKRGKGMWSHGWMHTREKVKHEKRLRSWPTSPGAPLPQIRNANGTELLVTTLDPDALSRQGRTVEKEDAYFERAMWIACWEMLRRGRSWREVSEWCADHKEGWRALSIGKGANPNEAASNAAWRKMCYLASQSGCSNEYEAAVYGLLGGSVKAVDKVCRSVDDTLYAYYNAELLRQFDQYLATNYPDRAPLTRKVSEDALRDPEEAIVALIKRLRTQPATGGEAVKPMKIIQSYLLANDTGSLIHTLGHAISYTDKLAGDKEEMIIHLEHFWSGEGNMPESEVALDPQTLRIVAHMAIILRVLSEEPLDGDDRDAEENVTVAYIQALRAAGKRDLIPIYASRLAVGRCVVSMARVLQDVTNDREQEDMLALMKNYKLDNLLVLNEQLMFLLDATVGKQMQNPKPIKMMEQTEIMTLYPGQRIVVDFLPEYATKDDEAIVRSLRWFYILDGHWRETFSRFSVALRKCLLAGRLACALSIVQEFPYDLISQRKSYPLLGRSMNLLEHEYPISKGESKLYSALVAQSKTYHDLEILVTTIRHLAEWRNIEHGYTGSSKKQRLDRAPEDVKEAKANIDESMAQILSGTVLWEGTDDDEIADLTRIREMYLTEVVIAYNSVLHTAGSIISRQSLIESMDLSVTIAAEESAGLAATIVKAGRMRELVRSFAASSKAMLILKDAGKEWKPRKEREGKDLSVWEIGPQVQLRGVEGLDVEDDLLDGEDGMDGLEVDGGNHLAEL